jgi:DNA (cytosine-5)-methyltransferase 1
MRHLDLFSGIGGFALAARWMGWQTVAFCEIEPYPQAVLRKHWPDVPIFDDVRTLNATELEGLGRIDLITGGFPCTDISSAGKKAGIKGKHSGLWSEFARIVGEIRPDYVVVENVADLLYRGVGEVLGDLATLGYDAEWHCIPATCVGAPFSGTGRDRVWIVAISDKRRRDWARLSREARGQSLVSSTWGHSGGGRLCDAEPSKWESQPGIPRVADGVPNRVDRIRALGNAIVPQVAFQIFQSIEDVSRG